jgi:hypothetical protein
MDKPTIPLKKDEPKILYRLDNHDEGTAVYIFDRAAVDPTKPFGVRFFDTDVEAVDNEKATIAVFFCPTMELAQRKVSDVTKSGPVSVRIV